MSESSKKSIQIYQPAKNHSTHFPGIVQFEKSPDATANLSSLIDQNFAKNAQR